jgi:hypothetical protein
LKIISYFSLAPSWIFGYTNQEYISADQRGEYQCATHLPDNIRSSNTLLAMNKKQNKQIWQLWLQTTFSKQDTCLNTF